MRRFVAAEKYLDGWLAEKPGAAPAGKAERRRAAASSNRACHGPSQPDILIIDKPDCVTRCNTGRSILNFVKANILNEQRCILVVTHDARINEFASRILTMEDGKLLTGAGRVE